jgi:hypothetical protein
MLLLESLDLPRRSVSFLALGGDRLRIRDEFSRLADIAGALGLRDLVLHFATPGNGITQIEAYVGPDSRTLVSACLGTEPFPRAASPGAVALLPRLSLTGGMVEGNPHYEFRLESCGESRPLLDAGLALMLATWGEEDRATLELRTALFEIGAHYLDHAEEIRVNAAGPCADELCLQLGHRDQMVTGTLRDDGPAFDPSGSRRGHLRSDLASVGGAIAREAGWFCRLLDAYEYQYEASGNRVGFHKRVGR